MNALPLTTNASGHVSRHHFDVSRPRTSASSAPPASISTSAHDPWAYMWMAELVKNAITGQRKSPSANATPGHRYARHARIRQTSVPTIASASKQRPMKRMPAPKNQWTISARGCIALLQIRDQRPCDQHGEDHTDGDHEQGRLGDEPPEPLSARMEQRHPVRLQDRPDDARCAGRRTDERQNLEPPVATSRARRLNCAYSWC